MMLDTDLTSSPSLPIKKNKVGIILGPRSGNQCMRFFFFPVLL